MCSPDFASVVFGQQTAQMVRSLRSPIKKINWSMCMCMCVNMTINLKSCLVFQLMRDVPLHMYVFCFAITWQARWNIWSEWAITRDGDYHYMVSANYPLASFIPGQCKDNMNKLVHMKLFSLESDNNNVHLCALLLILVNNWRLSYLEEVPWTSISINIVISCLGNYYNFHICE